MNCEGLSKLGEKITIESKVFLLPLTFFPLTALSQGQASVLLLLGEAVV